MNALVTLNLGNYLHPKTLESFQAAAERWGAELKVIQKPLLFEGRPVQHFWQKTLIPFDPDLGGCYDRMAVLDGDMLIREDCPSLFEVTPMSDIGVVCRDQPRHRRTREPQPRLDFWARRLGLNRPGHHQFLNGGLVVYSPIRHSRWLQAWRDAAQVAAWRPLQGSDQSSLSVILHGLQAPVTWLPWQFNTVRVPRLNAPLGRMQTYIYHFNSGGGKAGYHGRVSQCDWRA